MNLEEKKNNLRRVESVVIPIIEFVFIYESFFAVPIIMIEIKILTTETTNEKSIP